MNQFSKKHFGWIITGPVSLGKKLTNTFSHCACRNDISLQNEIAKFWQIEGFDGNDSPVTSNNPCEVIFYFKLR